MSQRLREGVQWLGRVEIMEPSRITRWLLKETPSGSRPRGRPRSRWMDQVEEDLMNWGITNWKKKVSIPVEWIKVLREARALHGL